MLDESTVAHAQPSGEAAEPASPGVPYPSHLLSKSGQPVPAHLLWDDVSPIQALTISGKKGKQKKSAGWGLKCKAEEGATAEARGVSEITLHNLPGYGSGGIDASSDGPASTVAQPGVEMQQAHEDGNVDVEMQKQDNDEAHAEAQESDKDSGPCVVRTRGARRILVDDDGK